MRFFRPCLFAKWFYPGAVFRVTTPEKIICLTFDDGPDPESTPELLEILERHKISAVFFCSGKAAEKYPFLVEMIIKKGHLVGNHGYHHYNGWFTPAREYCNDVNHASQFTSGKLFRPPYGRIRPGQYRQLRKTFKIIFWDLMSYDFDISFGEGRSLAMLNKKIRPGSIIVLHEKPGSSSNSFLENFLEMSADKGYRFVIPEF